MQFENLTSELSIGSKQKEQIRAHHCRNPEDVQEAQVDILKCWWDNQESDEEAYVLMGEALIRAGLKRIAREIWYYPPAMKTSKRSSAHVDNDKSSNKRMRTEPPMVDTRW